jgi:hypothetical protein
MIRIVEPGWFSHPKLSCLCFNSRDIGGLYFYLELAVRSGRLALEEERAHHEISGQYVGAAPYIVAPIASDISASEVRTSHAV